MYRIVLFLFLGTIGFSQNVVDKAKLLMDAKSYEQANLILADYLKGHPNDLVAIELLADTYSYQSKWEVAIEKYKYLVAQNPKNANYHYKHGGAIAMHAQSISKLKALGFIGEMKRAFLTAAKLDSKHIDTRWALVDMYVTLPGIVGGSYAKALKYAEELEKLSTVDGYLAKGYVYEYDNEPELAEKYYKQAIKIGGSVTCYDKLSTFYENNQQPSKAIQTIEKAHKKHQRNAMHYQIGKVSADYNIQLDKGEMCLKTYIKNYTAKDGVPVEWAYYRLAQINRHKNDKKNALVYIDKALTLKPDFKKALEEKKEISKM